MIDIRDLHKRYNAPVLQGVNLTVTKGTSCVIIGGSGSGKSVLLKCILGLEKPDCGTVLIDGQSQMPMERFGMLFQGGALFDSLPIWRNVAFRPLQAGMSLKDARRLAISKLDRVGLPADVADLVPAELSGGMAKRASLARAIATDPDIIFFDEPTTGLDPIRAAKINALIREVVTDIGATTITITHDMTTVRAVADQVAMLKEGVIHWQGTPDDIDRCTDKDVMQFINGKPV